MYVTGSVEETPSELVRENSQDEAVIISELVEDHQNGLMTMNQHSQTPYLMMNLLDPNIQEQQTQPEKNSSSDENFKDIHKFHNKI